MIQMYILFADFIVWMQQHIPFHTLVKASFSSFHDITIFIFEFIQVLNSIIGLDPILKLTRRPCVQTARAFPRGGSLDGSCTNSDFRSYEVCKMAGYTQLRCDTASVARSFSGQSGWPGRLHATVELRLMEEAGLEQSWSSFQCVLSRKKGP